MANLNISKGLVSLVGVTLLCVALTGCGRKLGCDTNACVDTCDDHRGSGIAHCIGVENTVVHFDFDKSNIRPCDHGKLERQAAYIKEHPNSRYMIEGHCDERGTEAYNMALGARRAHAVKHYLQSHCGVTANIDTTSYGKDRPCDPGHNEEAWAANRRAVTVEECS